MSLEFLKNKSILITGGTGSFGQQFIRRLLADSDARRIIIFSRDELKQSVMMTDIEDPQGKLRFFIGDVRDIDRLRSAFCGVDYVVHAAALKQVPALEYNPFEAIKTNILGTQNVIQAAVDNNVQRLVLVSTDKAAGPANLYGATKLCAEKLVVSSSTAFNDRATRMSVVRYGNVLGSRGSLLQVIERQRATGAITLTHSEMTRFWITLDAGVDLVLHALEHMHGGEMFIPKIPSMKVQEFIAIVAPECRIHEVGIRPGEKMHETLVTKEEARNAKETDRHFVILPHGDERLRSVYENLPDVRKDFFYSSDNNPVWLNEQTLKELLASI
ncbi:MAG: UDP-N-acetylglucosamine 4,6-dehydratase (inverting) [Candidatus Magasanikbacteria bacterium CG10_big_fil_rev_8_21_14_0_10_47_10]|uniref:UDP-N-acetylglucosamine 4,6-dehydratase (Inverting) n=1 Tax=Candidatus Magasanikbacteria bacterium CG10_big_fil_rev_8_21_14_0_10_47_10 TaxID=1974652 RepID=A0A2H0TPW1_9BACT|nr:MAG: UDP-N-acetylglucosamine 4,6-dehydratase (inverting) [Candidatus Magasanikbacteria bacterium CG10_big_fil_rev_8_21_14_0_10_47_10]